MHKNGILRRNLVIIVMVVILLQVNVFSAFAEVVVAEENYKERLYNLIEIKVLEEETYYSEINGGKEIDLSIDTIKKLKDFNGDDYTLVELTPTGYIIMHNDTGVFVEDSADSISPYYGIYGENLYYSGVTNYYYEDGGNYYNTIWHENILSEEDTKVMADSYVDILNALETNSDEVVLSYLKRGESEQIKPKDMISTYTAQYAGYICVNNYQYFTRLSDCGSNIDGTCSYIAAGILLGYYKYCNPNSNCIPSSALIYSGTNPSLSNSVHTSLVAIGHKLGLGNDIFVSELRDVVDNYLRGRNIVPTHYLPSASNNQVLIGFIKNNYPVIWSGNITSYGIVGGNSLTSQSMYHSVVVYGYYSSSYSSDWVGKDASYRFIAHFGWKGYNSIRFDGSMYNGNNGIYTFSPYLDD